MNVSGDVTLSDEELAANRADFGEEIASHALIDEYFRTRIPDFSKITVPLLSSGNWGGHGLHLRGNTEGFMRSGSREKWLELHGLEHWTHFYTDYGREIQLKFFAHFLKGEDNGWETTPRVILNVRHPDEKFVLRYETEWPLARTNWTKAYLDAADKKLGWEPVAEAASIDYNGFGEGVTFWSVPFEHETEITGPIGAKLFISSSTRDADICLVLRLFKPDGQEVWFQGALDPHSPIGHGWLRASHRKLDASRSLPYRPFHSHDEYQPLTPGTVYELDVEIWPTCIVIPPGYRLALSVQGTDYHYGGEEINVGWFTMTGVGPFTHDHPPDRPASVYGGKISVHTGGDHQGYLLLPVIPAA
jgi:predicted acyl esterase